MTPIPLVVSFLCLVNPFTASSQVITNGLIAYWSLDGGPQDDSGNGHDGTVSGATPTSDAFGVADGAYSFDGVNDYIDIGNGVKPSFPFSFIARFNGTESFGNGSLFSNDSIDSGGMRYGFAIYVEPTGCSISFYSGFATASTRYSRVRARQ